MDGVTASSVSSVCVVCELVLTVQMLKKQHSSGERQHGKKDRQPRSFFTCRLSAAFFSNAGQRSMAGSVLVWPIERRSWVRGSVVSPFSHVAFLLSCVVSSAFEHCRRLWRTVRICVPGLLIFNLQVKKFS